ncbi:MAG: branched-chain amino acid transport system II carrier protein [Bacillota bacterium]|nr:branched-chain amino acid transport system II carrier protein [Bacillota bacterium]
MKKFKDIIVVGFALFAIFLGAGNLIFPPTLGLMAGKSWLATMFGFMLTGVGLPVLGVIATGKAGGNTTDVFKPLGNKAAKLMTFLILLAIGPLLAIPRTAAVTYEIGVRPNFNVSPVISAIVFFAIVLYFTLNAMAVVDKIGSILTPLLLVVLSVLIIAGISNPIGQPIVTENSRHFLRGFEEGYQTMDGLGSLVLATIIIQSIVQKGYTDQKEKFQLTVFAGLIAAFGLFLVYGGFIYLGATASGVLSNDLSRADLLIALVNSILGDWGNIILGLAISLACLTTAVGLTATAGNFFSEAFHDKISYKGVVYFVCAFSAFSAINGVDTLINFAVPILTVLYPVTIVLIVMSMFDGFIKHKAAYKGACLGALIISLSQNILNAEDKINYLLERISLSPFFANITPTRVNFDTPIAVIESLPLSSKGFAWIVPAIVLGLVFALVERGKDHK